MTAGWPQCRWLLARGRYEEGKRALARLAPAAEPDLAQEAAAIGAQAQRDRSAQTSAWQALHSPALRSQLCLGSAASDACTPATASRSWAPVSSRLQVKLQVAVAYPLFSG